MRNQIEEVVIQTTVIGDTVFQIKANKFPSPTVPGTFMSNAEYFYINSNRVDRDFFDQALAQARAADDAAKDKP